MITFKEYLKNEVILESVKNKIQEYKVADPFLKLFLIKYSGIIPWGELRKKDKSENTLNQYINDVLLKKLIIRTDINQKDKIPNTYYTTKFNWESQLNAVKANAEAGDRDSQNVLNVFNSNPDSAKAMLENSINSAKKNSFEQWTQYITSGNDEYKKSIAFQYIILKSIFDTTDSSTTGEIPPLDQSVLADIYDEVYKAYNQEEGEEESKGNKDFNILKLYQDGIINKGREKLEVVKVGRGEWIQIPSKRKDPKNFSDNIQKLRSLSAGTNWCIAGYQMARKYLTEGDFHIYFLTNDNKSTAVAAIRMDRNDNIVELRGTETNQELKDDYIEEVLKYCEIKNLKGGEKFNKKLKWTKISNHFKSGNISQSDIEYYRDVEEILYDILKISPYFSNTEYENELKLIKSFKELPTFSIFHNNKIKKDIKKFFNTELEKSLNQIKNRPEDKFSSFRYMDVNHKLELLIYLMYKLDIFDKNKYVNDVILSYVQLDTQIVNDYLNSYIRKYINVNNLNKRLNVILINSSKTKISEIKESYKEDTRRTVKLTDLQKQILSIYDTILNPNFYSYNGLEDEKPQYKRDLVFTQKITDIFDKMTKEDPEYFKEIIKLKLQDNTVDDKFLRIVKKKYEHIVDMFKALVEQNYLYNEETTIKCMQFVAPYLEKEIKQSGVNSYLLSPIWISQEHNDKRLKIKSNFKLIGILIDISQRSIFYNSGVFNIINEILIKYRLFVYSMHENNPLNPVIDFFIKKKDLNIILDIFNIYFFADRDLPKQLVSSLRGINLNIFLETIVNRLKKYEFYFSDYYRKEKTNYEDAVSKYFLNPIASDSLKTSFLNQVSQYLLNWKLPKTIRDYVMNYYKKIKPQQNTQENNQEDPEVRVESFKKFFYK